MLKQHAGISLFSDSSGTETLHLPLFIKSLLCPGHHPASDSGEY